MEKKPATSRRVLLTTEEQLFRLQLRVARRADELARRCPTGGSPLRDRQTWRQAEGELIPEVVAAAERPGDVHPKFFSF